MRKTIYKTIASFAGGTMVFLGESFIPISWSWTKYALPALFVIWVLSLWEVYKWPFIPRLYLSLCTKLRDFRRHVYKLLSKGQILHSVHKDVTIRYNVEALTIANLNARIEALQSQVDKLKEDKITANDLMADARKAGIKEVVEYLNSKREGGYNFCVKIDWDEWQAKLKEWGLC